MIPRTLCAERCAAIAGVPVGDMDPLDICVLSERPISRSDIIMEVIIVGGLLMVDGGEADDEGDEGDGEESRAGPHDDEWGDGDDGDGLQEDGVGEE